MASDVWTISLRSGMFSHLKVVPITAAGKRAPKEEPLPRSRPATVTRMPMRGLPAGGDMDEIEELDQTLQPPAGSTGTCGKLVYMPKRSPDDSCRA